MSDQNNARLPGLVAIAVGRQRDLWDALDAIYKEVGEVVGLEELVDVYCGMERGEGNLGQLCLDILSLPKARP